MNLIGYLRVSSDSQIDGYGLASQESAVRAWCRNNNHRLVRLVSDLGVSGATDALDRPGLSEVLSALNTGEADGLVVARLDRLARALTVQEATLAVVWRNGCEMFTADTGRVLADDPDDPMLTALRQVVGVFAELDRRMVTKRLRDGRTAKAATGRKSVGSYAYGYVATGKGRTRDAAPQPNEQDVVRLIVDRRQHGDSFRTIATLLDKSGHAPRRAIKWSAMTVRAIVLRAESDVP